MSTQLYLSITYPLPLRMKQNCINIKKNSSFPSNTLTKSKEGLAILTHSPFSILTRLDTTWWPPGDHMRTTKLNDCNHLGIICWSHSGGHLRIDYEVVNSEVVNIYSYRHLVILDILTSRLGPERSRTSCFNSSTPKRRSRYDWFSDVPESWVWLRADFQSGSRVLYKKGVLNLFLSISVAYNVISCQKVAENTQILKNAKFAM